MATKKKKIDDSKEQTNSQIPQITENDLETKFMEGQGVGQQSVYRIVSDFLEQRMFEHFQAKNDELAKELREIYLLIKENVKNP
jgi:hypothetical protein